MVITVSIFVNEDGKPNRRQSWVFCGRTDNEPTLCSYLEEIQDDDYTWTTEYEWDGMGHRMTDPKLKVIPPHVQRAMVGALEEIRDTSQE